MAQIRLHTRQSCISAPVGKGTINQFKEIQYYPNGISHFEVGVFNDVDKWLDSRFSVLDNPTKFENYSPAQPDKDHCGEVLYELDCMYKVVMAKDRRNFFDKEERLIEFYNNGNKKIEKIISNEQFAIIRYYENGNRKEVKSLSNWPRNDISEMGTVQVYSEDGSFLLEYSFKIINGKETR